MWRGKYLWRTGEGEGRSVRAVRDAEQREAGVEPDPEDDVPEQLVPPDRGDAADRDERDLCDLPHIHGQPCCATAERKNKRT